LRQALNRVAADWVILALAAACIQSCEIVRKFAFVPLQKFVTIIEAIKPVRSDECDAHPSITGVLGLTAICLIVS
jgi:hypothetical protein